MSSAAREVLLQLFERHRAKPGTSFEESHFLDYLLAAPKGKRAVHNSFAGLRRYNAFINEVQLHFSICFSLEDFEASYSLNKFVERVTQLQASRRSSLASLRNQRRHGFGWGSVFVANLLAAALIAGVTKISPGLAAALLLLCVLANGVVTFHFLRWREYQKRLADQLQARAHSDV